MFTSRYWSARYWSARTWGPPVPAAVVPPEPPAAAPGALTFPLLFQNILDTASDVTRVHYSCWLSNGADGTVDTSQSGAALLRGGQVAAPGTFADFVMEIGQAPGIGKSWTFVLQFVAPSTLPYVDPSETYTLLGALTVTVAGTDTRALGTGSVTLTQGQIDAGVLLMLQATPANTPATMDDWRGACSWTPADGASMLYGGHMGSLSGAFGTRYQGPFFPATGFKTVAAQATNIMSSDGVINDIYVREDNYYVTALNKLQPDEGIEVYLATSIDEGVTWVRQDGTGGTVDTKVAVYGPGSPCHNRRLGVNLAYTAGMLVRSEWVAGSLGGGAGTTRQWGMSIRVTPDTPGEFMIGTCQNNASTSSGNTRYQSPINRQDSALIGTESFSRLLLAGVTPFTLSKYYIWQSVPAGVGATRTWTIRQTQGGVLADTDCAVTIEGATEVQDWDQASAPELTYGDEVSIKMVTANSPATTNVSWSIVAGVGLPEPPEPTGCPGGGMLLPTVTDTTGCVGEMGQGAGSGGTGCTTC